MKREAGFSMLELIISTAIVAVVSASVFGLLNPAQASFSVQPEAADVQQRLRVAAHRLTGDLSMAGAGAYVGTTAGSLGYYFAPIVPYRQGAIGDDPRGTYRADTITLFYVAATAAQTTIRNDLTSESASFSVNPDTGCPVDAHGLIDPSCGLRAGDTVLVYDATGLFNTFVLTSVAGDSGTLVVNKPAGAAVVRYKAGSKIVRAVDRTYSLKADAANALYQLVYYDGSTNADTPVVDHVVGLEFTYYGDPQPPALKAPSCDPNAVSPCTTYGPAPPAPGAQQLPFPPGENCLFKLDPASGVQVPRLDVLGGDAKRTTPVLLTEAQLTDGPWCPNADDPNRFDADLLRVRRIGVTLRLEAAVDALRGPAGVLFTRGGTAKKAARFLADQEIRFQVSPRNLALGR